MSKKNELNKRKSSSRRKVKMRIEKRNRSFLVSRLEKHFLGVVVENLGELFRTFALHAGDHFEYLAKNRTNSEQIDELSIELCAREITYTIVTGSFRP